MPGASRPSTIICQNILRQEQEQVATILRALRNIFNVRRESVSGRVELTPRGVMPEALDNDLADCVRVGMAGVERNFSRHHFTITDGAGGCRR
jgi:hypothetical protein